MHSLPDSCFNSPEEARGSLEALRWRDGVFCPHCGLIREAFRLHPSRSARAGLWKCAGCRRQFTVTVGTLLEGSHIALNQWLSALHLLFRAGQNGVSAAELQGALGITYKSARLIIKRMGDQTAGSECPPPKCFEEFIGRVLQHIPERRRSSMELLDRQWEKFAGR